MQRNILRGSNGTTRGTTRTTKNLFKRGKDFPLFSVTVLFTPV